YMDPARLQQVDVYGPRPIATGRRDQVQWSQLLTYIRLPDAARYFVAASPDGFSRASTSTAPRHWPRPCRSTHQVREATECPFRLLLPFCCICWVGPPFFAFVCPLPLSPLLR